MFIADCSLENLVIHASQLIKFTVRHLKYPVRRGSQIHIVGDHQNRLLIMSGCLAQKIHHILTALGIQIPRRWV